VQLRRRQARPDRADDLSQFFALSEDCDRFDNRDTSLSERMTSVHTLLVLDYLRRQVSLTHSRYHVAGELGPGSNLIDERVDLRGKSRVLLIRLPLAPALVIKAAPAVNKLKHAKEALMGQAVVHGDYRIGA
jgi:hypothetical protein